MSCSTAAQRSHRSSLCRATLSSTLSVWTKLSLCAWAPRFSTPLRLCSSGNIRSSNPVASSSSKPIDGTGDRTILLSSAAMRSRDTIPIRGALRRMASKVSSSIVKPSCEAKRTARIMRRGSSEKVMSGSHGVRMMHSSRSYIPSNGSTNSPNESASSDHAIALIVKSRRRWSSSSVPASTCGLRESCV